MMFRKGLRVLGAVLALSLASAWAQAASVNQAAWVEGTDKYRFGYQSIPNIQITNAPADTDFSRSAMLHDGTTYRLYFFKQGSSNTLYQFAWNGSTYHYGYDSIPTLTIGNIPADASTQSFAMLHDGTTYRLYLLSNDKTKVYQFGWNGSAYFYGYNSIPVISIAGAPADTDKSRWEMLHDGETFRLYFGKSGVLDKIYQFGWNGSTYQYGYNSIPVLTLENIPFNSNFSSFNMLHDGGNYRFYFLAP